jgi:probable HAF family extracellular repeat protein
MRGTTQMMGRALLGALVLAWMATAGWSQSLTWLGTLPGGDRSARLMVFPPTAPWWSAGLSTFARYDSCLSLDGVWWHARPRHAGRLWERAYGVSADGAVVVGWAYNAAGYGACLSLDGGWVGCKTSARCRAAGWSYAYGVSADGAVVVGWAENAAGQMACLSLDGVGWDARPRHAGRLFESEAYGVSADGAVVVGWAENAAGQRRAFRWTASGWDAGPRHAGRRLERGFWCFRRRLRGGRLGLLQRRRAFSVPFAGRLRVGCKTSARWAAFRALLMVFQPTAPWWSAGLYNAAGHWRAFRWTASGGMEDLNTTYASLLTNGSVLWEARAISPDGRYIVGGATTPPQGAGKPSCWIRASRGAGMWTATAVWTTPTCCKCCSRSAGAATATKTSTGTAQ